MLSKKDLKEPVKSQSPWGVSQAIFAESARCLPYSFRVRKTPKAAFRNFIFIALLQWVIAFFGFAETT